MYIIASQWADSVANILCISCMVLYNVHNYDSLCMLQTTAVNIINTVLVDSLQLMQITLAAIHKNVLH